MERSVAASLTVPRDFEETALLGGRLPVHQ